MGWLFESITDVSQKPTPLHVNLNRSPTSICLSSLASSEPGDLAITTSGFSSDSLSPGGLLGADGPSSATSSKALSTFSDDNASVNTRPTSAQGGPPPDHWKYEVLITVKLHGDIVPEKRGWHIDLPPNQVEGIKSVKVRSAALAKSTLLLVTMPIRCWILLADNPAYTFIDFVRTDSWLNTPERGPEPTPSPSPAIGPVERSDSDDRNKTPDHLPHIIAAIKDFFENKHETKEKPGPMRRITSKIGLHSSSSRFEDDPRYGYVRHIMQQLVIVRNEHHESHVSYDLQFREEKKLFERCKKHLIKEVLHNAGSNSKHVLESKVNAELDQLEREVLELVEVDKKRPKIEPKVASDALPPSAKPHTHNRQRSTASQASKHHEAIPEDREITGGTHMKRTDSGNTEPRLPRTESSLSMKKIAKSDRTDSMKSSRPLLSYLGRRISRDSGRSIQSPMHSPRATAHILSS